MSIPFNRKISEMMGKVDNKILKAKLDAATEMLKNEDYDELSRQIKKMDKKDLEEKLTELDDTKLEELGIDKQELNEKIKDIDLDKVANLLGEHGDEIMDRLKRLLKE